MQLARRNILQLLQVVFGYHIRHSSKRRLDLSTLLRPLCAAARCRRRSRFSVFRDRHVQYFVAHRPTQLELSRTMVELHTCGFLVFVRVRGTCIRPKTYRTGAEHRAADAVRAVGMPGRGTLAVTRCKILWPPILAMH